MGEKTSLCEQIGGFASSSAVPADLVILAAACEPEPENPADIFYMETKSLDGETNLKLHYHIEAMYTTLLSDDQVADLTSVVVCETPNSLIHRFDGEVMIFQQQKKSR